jgi:hypothetical protein
MKIKVTKENDCRLIHTFDIMLAGTNNLFS